jgi:hypothetical protein
MSKKNETAVAVVENDARRFLALSGDADFADAMRANLATGETVSVGDLIRVKTPAGGGRSWGYTNSDGQDVECRAITGLFVYYAPLGQLWGSDEPTKGKRPVLTSYDLRTAVRTNDDLGEIDAEQLAAFRIGDRVYDWKAMGEDGSPFGWGTGKGGHGRRIKESRTIAILQPGEAWPVILSAGAGSIDSVSKFVKRLKVPHFRVIVSATLTKQVSKGGIEYSQIGLSLEGTISREEGEVIKQFYTEPLKRIATEFDAPQDAA